MTTFDSCYFDFLSCLYAFLVGDCDLVIGSMVGYTLARVHNQKEQRSPATHFVVRTKLTIEKYFEEQLQYTYQGYYSK